MAEFGLETRVIITDEKGNVTGDFSVSEILPGAFTGKDLLQ